MILDFLDPPYLVTVCDEMSKFMCSVETGARTIILVGSEDYNRPVWERQRERVDIGVIKWQANYQNPLFLQRPYHILHRPVRQAERAAYLESYVL